MPAYARGELSLEAYLCRVLAALCRQSGGEIRIKGELVDTAGESTTLLKEWDATKQELVIRTHTGMFGEVFRVVPEKQPTKEVIAADPIRKAAQETPLDIPFRPSGSTMDDAKLTELERTLTKRRVASMISDELRKRRTQPEA